MQPAFTQREPRLRTRTRSLVTVVLAALLLAGCAGGGSTSSVTRAVGPGMPAQGSAGRSNAGLATAAVPSVPGVSAGSADLSKPGTAVVGVGPKLTKSASIDLQVKDISAASARVRAVATGLQAQVLNEQIGSGSPGDPRPLQQSGPDPLNGFGTLTLSVPADQLDTALDQLATIGTVQGRTVSSQDVTFQYVDTQSRLKTMRASVDRVRALMAQARDLGQVVALESEMSQREADLESLESELAVLQSNVESSTLTVSLSTPGHAPVTTNGFLSGLRSGWDAFTASTSGLLTAIGAVLPFALFVTLVGTPLVLWLRRHRANRQPAWPATGGSVGEANG